MTPIENKQEKNPEVEGKTSRCNNGHLRIAPETQQLNARNDAGDTNANPTTCDAPSSDQRPSQTVDCGKQSISDGIAHRDGETGFRCRRAQLSERFP